MTATVELDHTIVASRNARAAAQQLAAVLGVPWSERSAFGPFCPVFVNDWSEPDGHVLGALTVSYARRNGDRA